MRWDGSRPIQRHVPGVRACRTSTSLHTTIRCVLLLLLLLLLAPTFHRTTPHFSSFHGAARRRSHHRLLVVLTNIHQEYSLLFPSGVVFSLSSEYVRILLIVHNTVLY
jgi:hypothetical protein